MKYSISGIEFVSSCSPARPFQFDRLRPIVYWKRIPLFREILKSEGRMIERQCGSNHCRELNSYQFSVSSIDHSIEIFCEFIRLDFLHSNCRFKGNEFVILIESDVEKCQFRRWEFDRQLEICYNMQRCL